MARGALACVLVLALLLGGCAKVVAAIRAEDPEPAVSSAHKKAPPASSGPAAHAEPPPPDGAKYGVPFAWEVSKDEPLARARGYLTEILADNAINAGRGREHFAPFADKETPRATVVTCSDARVQASAWDATPENDAYTIRNLGNQVKNAYGSVAYGLEYLNTPVLLVLGHTGCTAVKAAMGNLDELEPPVKEELSGMKLPAPAARGSERKAWADAVIANVNAQVDFAVKHFGQLLREQRVSVVGAVYDFRNDLNRGYGRVAIVNVNGNTDPDRLRAFEAALLGPSPSGASDLVPSPQRAATPTPDAAALLNLIKQHAGGPRDEGAPSPAAAGPARGEPENGHD